MPVQKSRIVWSKCENVGSYLTTTLFKEKVKALLTGRRSLVPDTNVDSIPMTEFNTLKELATRSIVLGETSLDLSKRGNSMPELQKKALQARRPEKDDHSMSIPVSELTKWFEESNTHLVNFLKRNGKDRDEVIRRYFDPTKKGDDRLRVINSPIGGGHKAYGVRDIAERFLSGSITEWDHHPLLHDEQHFKLSQVAAGNILYCESEGRATCPSLTRRLDFNLGFIFLDENNNEHVFYIINKDVVDTLPRSVEYEIENLVTHEVTPVADGEATFAQINQGFRFKTKIQWVMDRSFLPVGTTTRPLKGIKPRPITYEGSALTDTHQNGQEIKKIKVIVDIFQWQVSVQVSKKRGRGNVASSSQFGRPVVEDSESLDPPNKKEPAAGRKKAAPQKAHS